MPDMCDNENSTSALRSLAPMRAYAHTTLYKNDTAILANKYWLRAGWHAEGIQKIAPEGCAPS